MGFRTSGISRIEGHDMMMDHGEAQKQSFSRNEKGSLSKQNTRVGKNREHLEFEAMPDKQSLLTEISLRTNVHFDTADDSLYW